MVLHFGISDPRQISLPIALYLVGNILGPIIFGPLSETYGRWSCLVISFAIYTLSTIGCGLAPNWSSLLIFRAFCGIGAAAPLTILGGVFSDIYADLRPRGIAVTVMAFMATAGALVGPVISGYASLIDWRWTFWGGAILAALNWPLLWFMPGMIFLGDIFQPTPINNASADAF